MIGLPSVAECLIILLLGLIFTRLMNVPKARLRAVRVLEDMRHENGRAAAHRADRSESDQIERFAVIGLFIFAMGCIAVLVFSQSGWV
ncbi:MAG: hypothetical protein DHS20C16_34860 [Phycisphaerae bacterium]|nr:MAG: hypothetical protein DHS20C16_34860 [Phycisphaerae bacterium]